MQERDKLQVQALIPFPVGEEKDEPEPYVSVLLGLIVYLWHYVI